MLEDLTAKHEALGAAIAGLTASLNTGAIDDARDLSQPSFPKLIGDGPLSSGDRPETPDVKP